MPYELDLDPARIHVQGSSNCLFLCGGETTDLSAQPKSLRDAFLKLSCYGPIKGFDLVQAEDVTRDFDFLAFYDDFLAFETDLAQIVELIILFVESAGSIAELGSFVVINEIASRLFIVVRDSHYKNNSFIKLGPLRHMMRVYGRESVCILDDADIGMRGASAKGVDIKALGDVLSDPLEEQLTKPREHSTFNPSKAGHSIQLIVGLIQEYGALTTDEIRSLLSKFGLASDPKSIASYLFCSRVVGWVKLVQKGSRDLHIARKAGDAATIPMKQGAAERNKKRRRTLIREYWEKEDKVRFNCIRQVFGGGDA